MYLVVFMDNVPEEEVPSVGERTFEDKRKALDFKHEHPQGKYAAVMPLRGTFGE